jgi:hypothetical protein
MILTATTLEPGPITARIRTGQFPGTDKMAAMQKKDCG